MIIIRRFFLNIILIFINLLLFIGFKIFKIKVLDNHLIGAVGHTTTELDYFFLLKKDKQIKDENFLLFLESNKTSKDIKKKFIGKLNIFTNTKLKIIVERFIQKNKSFGLDVGLGHYLNLPQEKIRTFGDGVRDWRDGFERTKNYWILRNKYPNYFPFVDLNFDKEKKQQLFNNLSLDINKKIVLVQIKTNLGNSCAKETDPSTYINTIKYFKDKGYQIVLVGREKIPKIFEKLSVINYANSKYVSWMNDCLLHKNCFLTITFGSGLGSLSAVLDKPNLHIGFWQLFTPLQNKKSLFIPTLLKDIKTGFFLKFDEQIKYCYEKKMQHFNSKIYTPVNPDEDDILEAIKELEGIIEKKNMINSQQVKFNKSFGKIPLYYCQSHISSSFLRKYDYLW